MSFQLYNNKVPNLGLHGGEPPESDLYVPGTGEDVVTRESNENFQQYPAGNYASLSGLDAHGRLQFPFIYMVGGLDHLRSSHDFQNESDGNHSSLSGGVGWVGDIQIVTPT
jgi:hypothetical protein